jgi:hypothetical protein
MSGDLREKLVVPGPGWKGMITEVAARITRHQAICAAAKHCFSLVDLARVLFWHIHEVNECCSFESGHGDSHQVQEVEIPAFVCSRVRRACGLHRPNSSPTEPDRPRPSEPFRPSGKRCGAAPASWGPATRAAADATGQGSDHWGRVDVAWETPVGYGWRSGGRHRS